jgi:hypothetical protein
MLRIVDIRYSGSPVIWVYDTRGDSDIDPKAFPLEDEKIEKILSSELPGRFWKLVQKKALEIYSKTK